MKYNISIKEQTFEIEVGEISQGMAQVNVNGTDYDVRINDYPKAAPSQTMMPSQAIPQRTPVAPAAPASTAAPQRAVTPPPAPETLSGGNVVKAPMPGLILDVQVKTGDEVKAGQTVIIMEAMKMENSITVKIDGTVKEIHVQKGAQVMTGHTLLVVS
jgi:biotin carboxyl carrier protein